MWAFSFSKWPKHVFSQNISKINFQGLSTPKFKHVSKHCLSLIVLWHIFYTFDRYLDKFLFIFLVWGCLVAPVSSRRTSQFNNFKLKPSISFIEMLEPNAWAKMGAWSARPYLHAGFSSRMLHIMEVLPRIEPKWWPLLNADHQWKLQVTFADPDPERKCWPRMLTKILGPSI